MRAYLKKAGLVGALLICAYLFYFFATISHYTAIHQKVPNHEENLKNQLDRIQNELQKLTKLVEDQKINHKEALPPEVKPKTKMVKLYPDSSLFAKWGEGLSEKEQREAQGLFEIYGYNAFLSNKLPLDRELPDTRDKRCLAKKYPDLPSISVILIYLNEALSVIKRAIRSIVDRTPKHLLKEIILVDDYSTYNDLGVTLQDYIDEINTDRHGLIKKVRHDKQMGLSQARITGWKHATADVVAVLDAHIEATEGWAEPLLTRIKADRTVVVSPVFDKVHFDDLHVQKYSSFAQGFDWALWCIYETFPPEWYRKKDESQPSKSPSLMGIFAADRVFLGEIGALDGGMNVYGGENVELGVHVWLCGGSVEVVPCSRIAHIERTHKPYTLDLSIHMRRNALRVAETWFDQYMKNVLIAWNLPLQIDKEALDSQLKEKKLKEEVENEKQRASDAERLHFSKVASILTNRQQKLQREMAQDVVRFRQQYQQPSGQRDFDLNDPELYKNMSPEEAQMMMPGLAGEDPHSKERRQRQREQLRDWLIQQQAEREEQRLRQKMEDQNHQKLMVEVNNAALELQNLEMENRKAAVIATKDYNLALAEEKRHQESNKALEVLDSMAGSVTKDDSPQNIVELETRELIKLKETQKQQIEEKQRQKQRERNEEHYYDRVRVDSARSAALIERQQAKLNKQMRQHLDSTNRMLTETRRQLKPDLARGAVTESFFSQFNTCSR